MRLAFVTSVTCTPPAVPPVMFHSSQQSMVPNSASPRSASARSRPSFSSSHWSFPAEKYVAGGRPALRLITSPPPLFSSAAAIRSVLVSCQTIALAYGTPVRRFHTTVVSR